MQCVEYFRGSVFQMWLRVCPILKILIGFLGYNFHRVNCLYLKHNIFTLVSFDMTTVVNCHQSAPLLSLSTCLPSPSSQSIFYHWRLVWISMIFFDMESYSIYTVSFGIFNLANSFEMYLCCCADQ